MNNAGLNVDGLSLYFVATLIDVRNVAKISYSSKDSFIVECNFKYFYHSFLRLVLMIHVKMLMKNLSFLIVMHRTQYFRTNPYFSVVFFEPSICSK